MKVLGEKLLRSRVPIFHVASMARSGETVVLRTLAAHPHVRVVHQIHAEDKGEELRLFSYLQGHKPEALSLSHRYLKYLNCGKADVLVVKQGVWEHRWPFRGFILSRNPAAIYASLLTYDSEPPGERPKSWEGNAKRLVGWMRNIDATLCDEMMGLSAIEQFGLFYNRRMGHLYKTGLPIIYYEKFVSEPRSEVLKILEILGVNFHDSMLRSHEKFPEGCLGHGKNPLGRPIDKNSLEKYKKVLTNEEVKEIAQITKGVSCDMYGYFKNIDNSHLG